MGFRSLQHDGSNNATMRFDYKVGGKDGFCERNF